MSKVSADKFSILLIDDEAKYRKNFKKICSKLGNSDNLYDVFTTGLGKQGFDIIDKNNAKQRKTLAFIDIILPDINGDELIEQKRNEYQFVHGVLISAHKTVDELIEIQQKYPWIKEVYSKPIEKSITCDIVNRFTSNQMNNIVSVKPHAFKYHNYNYDEEMISFLQREAGELKSLMGEQQWHMKKTVEKTFEMGKKLTEIKKMLPGTFDEWIRTELKLHFNRSTVYNFMQVWEAFGDCKEAILDSGMSSTNLYLLASPALPEEIRTKVFELNESGENVTAKMIKQLKKTYKRRELLNKVDSISTEIISPIPSIDIESKADDKNIITNNKTKETQKTAKTNKKEQQIVEIIKNPYTNNFHNLGKHILFCGHPYDARFIEKCPKKVSLNIAFSEDVDGDINKLFSVRSSTQVLFQSKIYNKDIDTITFSEIVQKSIEIYTEGKDILLFSHLPYPKLLLLAHELECHCFIAEPNVDKCKKIISIWNKSKNK